MPALPRPPTLGLAIAIVIAAAWGDSSACAAPALRPVPSKRLPGGSCLQWNIAGTRTIGQGNGITVTLDVRQSGRAISGYGSYRNSAPASQNSLSGMVKGSRLTFTVFWNEDQVNPGEYWGVVGEDGSLSGRTYPRRNHSAETSWAASAPAFCSRRATPLALPHWPAPAKPLPAAGSVAEASLGAGASACRPGFVYRAASDDDRVCVPPEAQARTQEENAAAEARRDPDGAYGSLSCRAGFVWREAFQGDAVCVTPEARDTVAEENRRGPSRHR